jgi:hypothetical protein
VILRSARSHTPHPPCFSHADYLSNLHSSTPTNYPPYRSHFASALTHSLIFYAGSFCIYNTLLHPWVVLSHLSMQPTPTVSVQYCALSTYERSLYQLPTPPPLHPGSFLTPPPAFVCELFYHPFSAPVVPQFSFSPPLFPFSFFHFRFDEDGVHT